MKLINNYDLEELEKINNLIKKTLSMEHQDIDSFIKEFKEKNNISNEDLKNNGVINYYRDLCGQNKCVFFYKDKKVFSYKIEVTPNNIKGVVKKYWKEKK